jgi:hypothetical protein
MDVDEEDEGDSSQRPRRARDYGIEADFDSVDDDDLAVRTFPSKSVAYTEWASRIPSGVLSLMEKSSNYQRRSNRWHLI